MRSFFVIVLLDVLVAPEEPLPAAGVLVRDLTARHSGRVAPGPAVAARLGRPRHVQQVLVERGAAHSSQNRADPVDLLVQYSTEQYSSGDGERFLTAVLESYNHMNLRGQIECSESEWERYKAIAYVL